MFELRSYQEEVVRISLEYFNNKKDKKNRIISAPLGSGKSIMIASIVNQLDNCLVFQPSVELLKQNFSKFSSFGGIATIYSASINSKVISKKTFATIGSVKNNALEFKEAGIKYVIMDECHKFSNSDEGMFKKFFSLLGKDVKILGFTATPFKNYVTSGEDKFDNYTEIRMLSRTKPKLFSDILYNIKTSYIVEEEFWKPIRYRLKNLSNIHLKLNSTKNDFTEDSLKRWYELEDVERFLLEELNKEIEKGKKTILIFMPSVEKAEQIQQIIPNSHCITSKTKPKVREELLSKINSKGDDELMILVNYGVLTTGVDIPNLDLLINARPTNSLEIHCQMFGRIVRLSKIVEEGLIIDFTNNTKKFGRIEDIDVDYIEGYGWSLINSESQRILNNVRLDKEFVYKKDIELFIENKLPIDAQIKKMTPFVLDFGKYEGIPINNKKIPTEYLEFILKNNNFVGISGVKTKNNIKNELLLRKSLKLKK